MTNEGQNGQMFHIFKKKPIGRNAELNDRLQIMRADMENNYKDAAQLDFKKAMAIYENLVSQGKLSDKEKAYYDEQIELAKKDLAHFTRFEGPGTGLYNSGTGDGLLQIGKPQAENMKEE